MTSFAVAPEWQSEALPGDYTSYPLPAFRSTIIEGLGLLVAGDPSKLVVYDIQAHAEPYFTIMAQDRLAGYTVSAGTLYVQDGPVLSAWTLRPGGIFAAFNLADRAGGPPPLPGVQAPEQYPALYRSVGGAAPELPHLPHRAAWSALRTTLLHLRATGEPLDCPFPGAPALLDELAEYLQAGLTGTAPAPQPTVPQPPGFPTNTKQAAAPPPAFSAPVVRALQLEQARAHTVFVLGADGTIHALDDRLTSRESHRFDRAVAPYLALAEFRHPQEPDVVATTLYYTTDTGAVKAIDIRSLAAWAPRQVGQVGASALLPPAVVDGLLWVGGGDTFLALPPNAPTSPRLALTEAGAQWQYYEVDPAARLVLLASATQLQLRAYSGGPTFERWGHNSPRPAGWLSFWPNATGAAAPAPRLLLHVEEYARDPAGEVAFSVFLADTSTPDTSEYASTYPPPPQALGTGKLLATPASPDLPRVGWVRSPPVIVEQTAYCLARVRSPLAAVVSFFAPGASGVRPFDEFVARTQAALTTDLTQDLPPLPACLTPPDVLVAYRLNSLHRELLPAAEARRTYLANYARGIEVIVDLSREVIDDWNSKQLIALFECKLYRDDEQELLKKFLVTMSAAGVMRLDSKYDGINAEFTLLRWKDNPVIPVSLYKHTLNKTTGTVPRVRLSVNQPTMLQFQSMDDINIVGLPKNWPS